MGFIVSDEKGVYGHSAKGTPCAAVFKSSTRIQITISLIVDVSGVKFEKKNITGGPRILLNFCIP